MKNVITIIIAGVLLAAPLGRAQVETGTSGGAQALDQARSGAISAGRTQTENVTVTSLQAGSKEVAMVEEENKWWSVNVSTGWDSLYMFRGVNVLGNGNGVYWIGADVGVSPWQNGTISAGIWYGAGSWWNGANPQERYGELDLFASYAHTFGALSLTAGWIYYYYPNSPAAPQNGESWTSQNEIMIGVAYDIEAGAITLTPNLTYYYNVGPELGAANGIANGGSSYLLLQLGASTPVAFDGAVTLEPYTGVGFNFGFNTRYNNGAYNRFNGGNNWQTGVALPIQLTSWLNISPYLAYSYQWQDLPTYVSAGNANVQTAVNTWWCGISANLSF